MVFGVGGMIRNNDYDNTIGLCYSHTTTLFFLERVEVTRVSGCENTRVGKWDVVVVITCHNLSIIKFATDDNTGGAGALVVFPLATDGNDIGKVMQ